MSVTEGNNTYEGVCAADDLTATAPCKVEVELDGDVIQGSVYCDDIPNRSTTMIKRESLRRARRPRRVRSPGLRGIGL